MPNTFLHYNLTDGYLQNWLVAGPLAKPISFSETEAPSKTLALDTLRQMTTPESGVTEPPVDLGPLGAGIEAAWRYYRCRDDHFVDLTGVQPAYAYLRAFAYAEVHVPAAHTTGWVLTTHGPADVWVNGQHVQRVEHFEPGRPRSVTLTAELQEGANAVLVRFETAGVGAVPFVMALQLTGVAEAEVRLPTNIEPGLLARRETLERIAATATLDRYVYGYLAGDLYDKNEPIHLTFPGDLTEKGDLTFRLQSPQGAIFQERTPTVVKGTIVPLARTFPLWGSPHFLTITPNANDYYKKGMRFERKEPFWVVRTPYSQKSGATVKARAQEALTDAAARRDGSLFTEVAKMALGQMDKVDRKVVDQALASLDAREPGAVRHLLAGLVAVRRFARKKPRLNAEIRAAIEACAARFIYRPDDFDDPWAADDFAAESRQLVYHTCEILSGQLWPEKTFEVTEQNGRWHRERGEASALAWMRQRGAYGFREWHSPAAVEETVAVLAVLIDLADTEAVSELAAVLLDKVLFGLAVNSFEGAYGASRGSTDTASVLSARLEPTSGLARLQWAKGNFNHHVMGTVCAALCRKYTLPKVIAQAATAPAEAVWGRERHARPADAWSVETAAYKTKDFMLASAQDYAPGSLGQAEHIWQATLGPDAVVFVNHPANMSTDDAHRPNFWAGNGVLPRVAQWGDVLLALYKLPEDDWLGYTHAYFPAAAFDEHKLDDQWAFARKGTGYLALRAGNGLQFVTTGLSAKRELRSAGRDNVWLCHMGQALLDGSFEAFQTKIKALDVTVEGLSVRAQTLRGDQLVFGWEEPLLINGEAQPLAPERHIENPYCVVDLPAAVMDIVGKGEGVRLRFE